MKPRSSVLASALLCGVLGIALADGPQDNIPEKVRPVPPPGIAVPEADRATLDAGLADLGRAIEGLRANTKAAPLLPDVEIYHNAVRYALQYNEFFAPGDINKAKNLLNQGIERARQLAAGNTPWLHQPGPGARGYRSEIDGSVQPYGLFLPESYTPTQAHRWRLDTWFHGRGENLSEVNFIDGVQRGGGPFVRPDTITLQPYGRYCCANKLPGEADLFEALADIRRRHRIDDQRIVLRGFSMGGASCWQFAAHYASDFAAAAPGAGFSETPEFLRVFQDEKVSPPWWERKLWQMYDCPNYAQNFFNIPTVAYSGEIDRQKQAADVMAKALGEIGIDLVHIIGPKTAHSYHPQAIVSINERIDAIAARGRDIVPRRVLLATPTLKYNRQAWVTVDGLGKHWETAHVDARLTDTGAALETKNVTALSLAMPPGRCPLEMNRSPVVKIDGTTLDAPKPGSDRSWVVHFRRDGSRWTVAPDADPPGLRKRHDLQGPIDDAFTRSFLFVQPTDKPMIPEAEKWVNAESARALTEWRRQFRGDARVKRDAEVTDADIAAHNLVLWGDPGSNKILARVLAQLPVRWTSDQLTVNGKSYSTKTHVPVFIFPNPLNPSRYVVVNSSFTYREYDYLNNARQVPKLPDWAVIDTTTPPNSRYPGKVTDAGFFGERWEWVPPQG